ncbi:hypothetical protein E2562_005916 [Oryza meyeriana var. granulata]|uniref:Uncharacterized protein n=1 Tax=Oryza meyeriana var. granulata TaxID=110450 RepID=A0A6G1DXB0_9ORYZ|nr:hypothetical protein E2562_005916 [Oryza meyeriana var. granulata]
MELDDGRQAWPRLADAPPPVPASSVAPSPPDVIALVRTLLPVVPAPAVLHDAPAPTLLHDVNRYDLELAEPIPTVDWDSLQIVDT